MKKLVPLLLMMWLASLPAPLRGQTEAVKKTPSTDRITENLKFGTGRTVTVEDGATLTLGASALVSVNGAVTFADNVRQTFNPGEANAGINVGAVSAEPSSLVNGDVWYNSSDGRFYGRMGAATMSFATLTGAETLTNKTINGTQNSIANIDLTGSVTNVLPLANGGTGAALVDPNADVLLGWSDGAGAVQFFSADEVSALLDGAADPFLRTSDIPVPVQAVKDDTGSSALATFEEIPSLDDLQVTTQSAGDKVLVRAVLKVCLSLAGDTAHFRLTRNGTAIGVPAPAGSRVPAGDTLASTADTFGMETVVIECLDTPGSAGTHSYAVEWRMWAVGQTVFINRSLNDADATYSGRVRSTLTATPYP